MEKVPIIISNKDLMYIEDMINWQYTIAKKIKHYLNIVNDKDIINEFNEILDLLNINYDVLLSILSDE